MKLLYGTILAIIGQILTFIQMQGGYKWKLYEKYPLLTLLLSIPISWCFIKSVHIYIDEFKGNMWPSRIIGFGFGVIVFSLLSYFLFDEHINTKTFVCILLAIAILLIQFYWK